MLVKKFVLFGMLAFGGFLGTVTPAMADVEFLGVDAKATLISNNTTAVVTGAIVCDAGTTETFTVTGVITQNHGKTNVTGQGTTAPVSCTGTVQVFSVNVSVLTPPNETFKKGPASLILGASTTDGVNYDNQTITAKIQLTN